LTPEKGQAVRIAVSAKGPEKDTARYAMNSRLQGVFVLAGETVKKLQKSLADFKAK